MEFKAVTSTHAWLNCDHSSFINVSVSSLKVTRRKKQSLQITNKELTPPNNVSYYKAKPWSEMEASACHSILISDSLEILGEDFWYPTVKDETRVFKVTGKWVRLVMKTMMDQGLSPKWLSGSSNPSPALTVRNVSLSISRAHETWY